VSLARRVLSLALLGALLTVVATATPASAAETTQVTWHGTQIKMYGAQSAGHSGSGVIVAVLDGWLDRTHPDFQGRALAGADCRSGTCKPGGTVKENCGSQHGTHVAGTVASSSYGVAPKATILPVQVLTSDSSGECTGTPTAVAAGIRYAISQGAKVLNLSLGPDVPASGNASAIPAAVHEAAAAGAVVVFSAGNADLPVAQSYGNDALIVAATGPDGGLASYSQYGTGVSVAAPGGQPNSANTCTQASCITSLYPGNGYAVAAGTSMAAPHVAGLAALLFGQASGRSRATVVARIKDSATPLANAGAGLINVRAALGVSGGTTPPKPSPTQSRTTSPKPAPVKTTSPTPKPVTTTAAPTGSATPAPAVTTGAPTATPTPTSSNSITAELGPPIAHKDDVPMLLSVLAGALVLGSGAGVLTLGRKKQ
jgi:subtilisin family serine protease